MDAGMAAADTLEKQITKRISEVYGDALKTAIKQNRQFFKKLQDIDSGKIKPPAFYDTPEKIAKWREGYIRELMRMEHVTESITQQIKDAGAAVSPEIEKELAGVYAANANYTAQKLTRMKANAPSTGLISSVTRKQAAIIIKDKQPLFSKIAFNNLQNAPAVVKRLQNEMLQASLLGESQQQIIKRIQGVMNNSAKNAKRIAQTERTRLQSQARNDKLKEAEAAGVTVMKEWSCAMMATSRESHIALDGKRVKMGEKFRTIWGNDLEFPGDPNAPAKEVINCHCVMVPDVATEEEENQAKNTPRITFSELQNDAKNVKMDLDIRKHARARMPERSVTEKEIAEAMASPLHVTAIKTDESGQRSYKMIGPNATVCINPDTGKIVTAWQTGTKTRGRYGGDEPGVYRKTD